MQTISGKVKQSIRYFMSGLEEPSRELGLVGFGYTTSAQFATRGGFVESSSSKNMRSAGRELGKHAYSDYSRAVEVWNRLSILTSIL